MRRFTLQEVCTLPVLKQGHTDNLVYQGTNKRVWISRMTVEDGQPYDNQITVEKLVNGVWAIKEQYQAK